MARIWTCLAVAGIAGANAACQGPRSPEEFLKQVADPSIYDKTLRPGAENGPTVVEVQLGLVQMDRIDVKAGTNTLNGYLRSWWQDPRLAYNGTADGGCTNAVSFDKQSSGGVWEPDLYIDNLVTQTVEGMSGLLQISPDGKVWKSEQVLMTVKGKFDLSGLPFDKHQAEVVVASYSMPNTELRVTAKAGTAGAGMSGIGVASRPLSSKTWTFPQDDGEGLQTEGKVEIRGGWDYLIMSWEFWRQPKYFLTQVVVPGELFLLISYMQFWVPAAAVPARAALAVIPVLILRTMSNSIYSSIPQGSQFMWLDMFLQIVTLLCVAAGLHFGIVQALRGVEAKNAEKLAGLVKARPVTEKLIGLARQRKIRIVALLRLCAPVEETYSEEKLEEGKQEGKQEGMQEGAGAACADITVETMSTPKANLVDTQATTGVSTPKDGEKYRVQSEDAKELGVTEADMLFVMYTRQVFEKYDKGDTGALTIAEIRAMFTHFNVYMSVKQVTRVVGQFLRDEGHRSLLNEGENELRFSQLLNLLIKVDKYSLRLDHDPTFKNLLMGMHPSERWDYLARGIFPLVMLLQLIVMFTMLAAY